MLQVLVIGAGTMGRTHAAAYASMPGVKLAGIADIRAEKHSAWRINTEHRPTLHSKRPLQVWARLALMSLTSACQPVS